jgi:HrpA-like RNA helicase
MVNEIRYICKDCGKEFKISKEVYNLMSERGESIPERCKEHRKSHKEDVRDIELPYFWMEPKETLFMNFGLSKDSHTFHGERNPEIKKKQLKRTEMRIRITDEHIFELYEKLDKSQVVILASPTGTGKSTLIPFRLISAPSDYAGDFTERLLHQGQFIQTQPLSSAVERIPETISRELLGGSEVGEMELLGLRHRGDERYDRKNLGVIVTDGSLRNWIRDGHLCQYSLIMVDEAHQRTCNIDTILMLLKNELLKHPQLRLIVSSATINVDEFKETFQKEGISVDVFDLSETLKEERNYCGPHFWRGEAIKDCDCWLCLNEEKRKILQADVNWQKQWQNLL